MDKQLQGMLAVYVDCTPTAGDQEFMIFTDNIPEKLESEPRKFQPFVFAGVTIDNDKSGSFLEQTKCSEQIRKIPSECDFDLFRITRHRLAMITETRPESFAGVNFLWHVAKETF